MNVIMDKANNKQEQVSSQVIPWKDTPNVKTIRHHINMSDNSVFKSSIWFMAIAAM